MLPKRTEGKEQINKWILEGIEKYQLEIAVIGATALKLDFIFEEWEYEDFPFAVPIKLKIAGWLVERLY